MTKRYSQSSNRRNAIEMTVHIDATETFTTVVVMGSRYVGIGTAKRHPNDAHDAQRGIDIASARALRDLADQTERGAW